MNTSIYNDLAKAVVVSNTNLPNQVFNKKFDQYLFFDSSLRATGGISVALKNILNQVGASQARAAIFTSITNDFLMCLNEKDEWEESWKALDKKLFDSLVAESFTVISLGEDWAAFQYYPVDIGIIGFGKSKLPFLLENEAVDFFSCTDILAWYASGTDEDAQKVKYYGKEFLDMLLKNYKSNM
ncbi:MAG: hypothetical protein V4732_04040 [Pseudomonadota bacterium]